MSWPRPNTARFLPICSDTLSAVEFNVRGNAVSILKNSVDHVRHFITSESGAVTVDWVVLTAATVGLGIATTAAVRTGTHDLSGDISTSLSGAEVASLGCLGSAGGPAGFDCYTGPTIVSAGLAWGHAWAPSCFAVAGGSVTCNGSGGSEFTEQYTMSDGSTYHKVTRNENGETTVTWTDSSGNPVDEPPPMS